MGYIKLKVSEPGSPRTKNSSISKEGDSKQSCYTYNDKKKNKNLDTKHHEKRPDIPFCVSFCQPHCYTHYSAFTSRLQAYIKGAHSPASFTYKNIKTCILICIILKCGPHGFQACQAARELSCRSTAEDKAGESCSFLGFTWRKQTTKAASSCDSPYKQLQYVLLLINPVIPI